VLGVTGLRHAGTKVGFSNLGPEAAIGAPGGNCVNTAPGAPCLFSIVVATNTGLTSPDSSTYTNQFNFNVGTSFSAPLVAGAAALMHAVNGRLAPANFISLLRKTAAPFAAQSGTTTNVCRAPVIGDIQNQECICTTQTCGAGMLNTHAAVLAAQRPFAVASAPTLIDPGVTVSLNGSASFASDGRSISAYQWSLANVIGAAPSIADQAQAETTLQVAGPAQFTLRLTVIDDQSAQDATEMLISTSAFSPMPTPPPPAPAPAPAPRPAASGGGGGGSAPFALLVGLLGLALARRSIAVESAATPARAGSRETFRPDFRV
jgi:serine protease